jgi:hypothetical protein
MQDLLGKFAVAQLLKKSPASVDPEGLLHCLQQHIIGNYPEPDESNPKLQTHFLLGSILLLSSHLRLDIPSGLFPLVFSNFSFSSCVLHAKSLSSTLISSL